MSEGIMFSNPDQSILRESEDTGCIKLTIEAATFRAEYRIGDKATCAIQTVECLVYSPVVILSDESPQLSTQKLLNADEDKKFLNITILFVAKLLKGFEVSVKSYLNSLKHGNHNQQH